MKLLHLSMAFALAGCAPHECAIGCSEPDVLAQVVLRNVPWVVNNLPGTSACAMSWAYCSPEAFATLRKRAADLREWADGLTDVCVKAEYYRWADHVDSRVAEGEKEMLTHNEHNRYRAYLDRSDALWKGVDKMAPSVPAPPR